MLRSSSKRNTTASNDTSLSKKQRIDAVKRLCNEFYPRHISGNSDYGIIKEFITKNQTLYPCACRYKT